MATTHVFDYPRCKVPLRRVDGAFDVSFTCHEGIVDDVWEADRRWRYFGGPDFFLVRQRDTGSYNCRNSVGHSRGVAIDFNWTTQPMVSKRSPCPQDDGMKWFYEWCWKPLGYGWGGYWRSKCDAMHVSKVPNEGGDGILYRTWPTPEPVTPVQPPRDEEEWFDMDRQEFEESLAKVLGQHHDGITLDVSRNAYTAGVNIVGFLGEQSETFAGFRFYRWALVHGSERAEGKAYLLHNEGEPTMLGNFGHGLHVYETGESGTLVVDIQKGSALVEVREMAMRR